MSISSWHIAADSCSATESGRESSTDGAGTNADRLSTPPSPSNIDIPKPTSSAGSPLYRNLRRRRIRTVNSPTASSSRDHTSGNEDEDVDDKIGLEERQIEMAKYDDEEGVELDPFLGGNSSSVAYARPTGVSHSRRLFAKLAPRRRTLGILVIAAILFSQAWIWGPSVAGKERVEEWSHKMEQWKPHSPWGPPPPPPPPDPLEDLMGPPGGIPPPPEHVPPPPEHAPPPPPPPKHKPHLPAANGPSQPTGLSDAGMPVYPPKQSMPAEYEPMVQNLAVEIDAAEKAFPPQVVHHISKEKPSKAAYNYREGDPHLGIISQSKLSILEREIVRQRPLPGPQADYYPPERWTAHTGWSRQVNGSKTRMEDALRPDEQAKETDWRPGAYSKWNPVSFSSHPERTLPPVQFAFPAPDRFSGMANDADRDDVLEKRRRLVRSAFLHAWEAYKRSAWGHDEIKPVTGTPSDGFNGWGASIVDSLDTLLIMELPEEYNLARQHVRDIDFHLIGGSRSAYSHSDGRIPVFETAIRYLGGFLSAYDLSGDELMLDRGEELAQLIMPSFETFTGVPVGRIRFDDGVSKPTGGSVIFSEAASMLLEFTRLWQVSGNRTYFDRVHRITDWLQYNMTGSPDRLGALLPASIFPDRGSFYGWYTWGGMIDSAYEYLIKEHQLLGGRLEQYAHFFTDVVDSTERWLLRSVNTVPDTSLLVIGQSNGKTFVPKLEHLTCFAGGSIGLGAKLLSRGKDLDMAQRLTETCWWAYNSTATGIGPEEMVFYREKDPDRFESNTLTTGTIRRGRPRGAPVVGVKTVMADYRGRPETIESVMYMWRITGDRRWQERGWQMFASWVTHSLTDHGFSSLGNVLYVPASLTDSMESYVFAETFKYYYLLFSPPSLISLDDYVFSTEAHPFLLPKKGKWGTPGKGPRPFWDPSTLATPDQQTDQYTGGEGGPIGGMTRMQKVFVQEEWEKEKAKAEAILRAAATAEETSRLEKEKSKAESNQRAAAIAAEKVRLEKEKLRLEKENEALKGKVTLTNQLRRMISMVAPSATPSATTEAYADEDEDGVWSPDQVEDEVEEPFVPPFDHITFNARDIVVTDDAPVMAQVTIA